MALTKEQIDALLAPSAAPAAPSPAPAVIPGGDPAGGVPPTAGLGDAVAVPPTAGLGDAVPGSINSLPAASVTKTGLPLPGEGPQQQMAREIRQAGPKERAAMQFLAGSSVNSDTAKVMIADARSKDLEAGWDRGAAEAQAKSVPMMPSGPSDKPGSASGVAAAPGSVPGGPISAPYQVGGARVGGGGIKPPFDIAEAEDKKYLNALEDQRTALAGAQSAETNKAIGVDTAVRERVGTLKDLTDIQDSFRKRTMDEASENLNRAEVLAKQAAAEKIDPEHYWNTKSTGTKIGLALAMGLGELGAHMPHVSGGGQNLAGQLIQQAIQRDVESQKDNIANKWKAVSEGTDLAKNKIGLGNYMSDQMDKANLLAEAKLRVQLEGLMATADSAAKKAFLAAQIADSTARSGNTVKQNAMNRYSYSMNVMAAGAARMQQEWKEYGAFYDKANEENRKAAANPQGGKILPVPGFQEWRMGKGVGVAGIEATPGSVPARDREEANKELTLQAEGQSLTEAGKNVHSVSYDPRRYLQDTDAGKQKLINDQYRTQAELLVKKVASLRMPEEEKNAALSRLNSVIPQDGDNEARTRAKVEALPHVVGSDITPILRKYGAAPAAPPPPLPGEKPAQ